MKAAARAKAYFEKLNRFTTLPILLDILQRKQLFVPDYSTWEDKNDTAIMDHYLERMKAKKGVNGLRAICFTHDDETIHHWSYFSRGVSGCCIEFDFQLIVKSFEEYGGFSHGAVDYLNFKKLRKLKKVPVDRLPFTKRWPYRIESEYRFFKLTKSSRKNVSVPFDLASIRKITFNQSIPKSVLDTIKQKIDGVEIINRSTVYRNAKWINLLKDKSA